MRKALLVASIAIVTMTAVVSAADFGLDFKGGLNLASMRGDGVDIMEDFLGEKKTKLGAISGIGAQIGLADNFAIQPEVLFSSKGLKLQSDVEGVEVTSNSTFNYLEVPILFKLRFPTQAVVPNFYAGPSMGFTLAANTKAEAEGVESEESDVKDDVKGFDFDIAMGGGIDIKAGSGRVILDLRYTLGLSDVNEEEEDGFEAKNGAFSTMVGYGFDF